ncbi:hypothetical protein [uncultured Leifsonia sp.]|uniref:hypothetical protein n=1 Tax=uncultured Leifsonia sp. TaxID=340359 RepID=UPI0025D761F2|nr:hypothetical protein [uncultured Leifsonia sp.]
MADAPDSAPVPTESTEVDAESGGTSAPQPVAPPAARSHVPRWVWAMVAAVTVLTTAAGVTISLAAVAAVQSMPTVVVGQYLRALEHGHATAAMKLAGIEAHSGDVLLTDEAYGRITDRITSFSLAAPVTHGTKTTVQATITQGDRTYQRSFAVQKDGGVPFLPFWRLSPVEPDTLDLMVDGPQGLTYTVAGEKLTSAPVGTDVQLRALPGTYPVAVTSKSKNFDVPVTGVTTTPPGLASSPAVFTAQLSSSGQAAAQKAIDTWLDSCVASHDAKPADCPFWTEPQDSGDDISNVRWQLLTRPTATVQPVWSAGGWSVDSTSGSIGAEAVLTRRSDGASGVGVTDPFSFSFGGLVTFDGSGAVFTPQFSDSPGEAGA